MIKTTLNNISTDKKVVDITKEKNKNIVNILKGTVISILLSLILLTIYSALLSFTNISESTMTTVVLVITGISILLGSSMSSINSKIPHSIDARMYILLRDEGMFENS